jgi:hypothetical protein
VFGIVRSCKISDPADCALANEVPKAVLELQFDVHHRHLLICTYPVIPIVKTDEIEEPGPGCALTGWHVCFVMSISPTTRHKMIRRM